MIAANSYDNWIGLGLAGLGIIYLFIVLIFPEHF